MANAVKTKNDQVSQIDGILKSAQAENKSDADRIASSAESQIESIMSLKVGTDDFGELHDRYSRYGSDELDRLMDASDGKEQINTKIDKTIRQMESGSESSKHAANVLSNLSRQLDDLNVNRLVHRPKSAVLRKIYDPLRSFTTKSKKTGKVIGDIMGDLEKMNNQLYYEIIQYRKDQVLARKIVTVSMRKGAEAEAIATALAAKIKAMEKSGEDPEMMFALKSNVLAAITRRSLDLYQIAQTYAQYIVTSDVLIKVHEKMTDEISSAKEVSVVQFRNAVRIAQGISTEETALKMTTALKEASSNLTKANSAALSDSVQKIYDSAQTSSGSIEDMMASIDSVCNTIDTMHKREAETADILLGEIGKYKDATEYMQKRIQQTKLANDQKTALMKSLDAK